MSAVANEIQMCYKHGTYVIDKSGSGDAVIAKVNKYHPDGRVEPCMMIHENVNRDFYITREGHRNYVDKLEWLEEKKLQRFPTTERNMNKRIMQSLNMMPGLSMTRKMLFRNPYIFGGDIDITCILGQQYAERWPDKAHERSTIAVIDIETNVHSAEKEIIMCTITFKKKVFCAITHDFSKTIDDPEHYFREQVNKHIGDTITKRDIDLEIFIADTPGAAAKACIEKAHAWKPDFLTLWNLDYDMPRIFKAIEDDGHDLEDVFSDPAIPRNYRYFRYHRGLTRKQKASGEFMSIPPAEQWHTVYCPASFYIIDAMPVYRILRRVDGMLPSYSLDYVTKHELGEGKLKFKDPDEWCEEGGLDWHRMMQRKHKGVYLAYNIIDCIRIEELDERTTDLCSKIGILKTVSHYKDFNSNPRRICDQLHFYLKDKGFVIGTTSDSMMGELDKYVVDMGGWIITLSPVLIEEFGIKLVDDLLRDSMFYIHNADLDIVSTYPKVGIMLNISKETCVLELAKIQNINGTERRSIGINLTGGKTNALILAKKVLKLKAPTDLLPDFDAWCEEHNVAKKENNAA